MCGFIIMKTPDIPIYTKKAYQSTLNMKESEYKKPVYSDDGTLQYYEIINNSSYDMPNSSASGDSGFGGSGGGAGSSRSWDDNSTSGFSSFIDCSSDSTSFD